MAFNSIDNFYQSLSRAIRRGKVYDEDIPGFVEESVRELEDIHNLKHMWVETTGTMNIGTGTITLTDLKIKSVRFISLTDVDGNEFPLRKTMRENVIAIVSGRPGAFWMKSNNVIGLDNTPDKQYTYAIGYYQYSTIPLEDTLAFLADAPDLLRAMTLVNMAPIIRDDKLTQRWGQLVDKRLPSYLEAQVVHEEDGVDNVQVPFVDEYSEDGRTIADFV